MTELIKQYIAAHPGTIVFALGFVATAFASTMPDHRPKNLDDLWAWGREFVRQVFNAKRPTQPNP